jgi:hypothetical protein
MGLLRLIGLLITTLLAVGCKQEQLVPGSTNLPVILQRAVYVARDSQGRISTRIETEPLAGYTFKFVYQSYWNGEPAGQVQENEVTAGASPLPSGDNYFRNVSISLCGIYFYNSTQNLMYFGDGDSPRDPDTNCPTRINYQKPFERIR